MEGEVGDRERGVREPGRDHERGARHEERGDEHDREAERRAPEVARVVLAERRIQVDRREVRVEALGPELVPPADHELDDGEDRKRDPCEHGHRATFSARYSRKVTRPAPGSPEVSRPARTARAKPPGSRGTQTGR